MNPAIEPAVAASFLSKLPRELVEPLLAEGTLAEVPTGLVISVEQVYGQVALVVSGLFRLFARAKSGRQVTVSYSREGDLVGLTSALTGPCRMGMQSLSAGSLWVMSGEVLKRHALADARLAWALAEVSAQGTYDLLEELADTTFGTVRQRVARHLLDLVVEGPPDAPLVAPISQQELANAVGTVREVVSRVLQVFRSEGLVRATQAGLEVLDATQLYQQSQVTD
jgi:CRP/FNR family cyclic AMP-dependent transcriptional regulator